MINLEKANCSTPPGRNPAIFKFRDDACSQIKYSALCKRKQEEARNIPALSGPCSPLPIRSLGARGLPETLLQPRDARLELRGCRKPGTGLGGQSHTEHQMLNMCQAVSRKRLRNPLTQILPPRTRPRLSRSHNEMKQRMNGWQPPHRRSDAAGGDAAGKSSKGLDLPPRALGLVTQPPRRRGEESTLRPPGPSPHSLGAPAPPRVGGRGGGAGLMAPCSEAMAPDKRASGAEQRESDLIAADHVSVGTGTPTADLLTA